MTLEGLVDLHVHTEPDVRQRSCDDLELAREAKRVGARAVVIKSHHFVTADRAAIARAAVPGVGVFGGVTLNPSVGGLNPAVVEAAITVGAKIVWLPTLFATNHRKWEKKEGGVPVVTGGVVVPAAQEIFRQIAAADIALATGHLAAAELHVTVATAWKCGVRRILINHPEHDIVALSIDQQRELRREFPVWFERCYAQPMGGGKYRSNFEANLRAIEALGAESTVLASDVGQIENPPWAECWERTAAFFAQRGMDAADWRRITQENPAAVLKW
jgi:hypothetical protein